MQFTHDLEALKQAFSHQNTQLSHLKEVLAELDPRLAFSLDPGVFDAIDEALERAPTLTTQAALPLAGTRG
ncbi:MAG TPA: hypothetical protein VI197_35430 [Polyangiaceae bacterium]